jgi:hypothetical protein
MKWLLNFLIKIGRRRIVMDRQSNEPYLERYYLFLKERKLFPFNVFLHKFLRSDPDDVHDHPWSYFTLILKGGYYEWLPQFNSVGEKIGELQVWRGPGHFRICGATSYHRIELDPSVTCWTLFVPGPQTRDWGFLSNGQWISHEQYLTQKR